MINAIRILTLAAMLCALLATASAQPFTGKEPVHCTEGLPGCEVLQMVMMGSFDDIRTDDKIGVRVMSAALGQLRAVTEADGQHFLEKFDVDPDELHARYYDALSSCLLADILLDPGMEGQEMQVRRVLRLFLNPQDEWNAQLQMDIIRQEIDEELMEMMAQTVDLPVEFIEYVFENAQTEATMAEAE